MKVLFAQPALRSSERERLQRPLPTHCIARVALLFLAALISAGCVSPIAPYQRPAAPVAAQYADASTTSVVEPAGRSAARLGWRNYFPDPALQQLIETALAGNRDLKIATIAIEQAIAQLGLREADRLPIVGIGIAGSSAQQPNGTTARSFNSGLKL